MTPEQIQQVARALTQNNIHGWEPYIGPRT